MTYTKGPWKVNLEDEGLHTIWSDDNWILIARTCFAPASEANARLIAAAPELLEALEYSYEYISGIHHNYNLMVHRIKKALHKARGIND